MLRELATKCPPGLRELTIRDIKRQTFHVHTVSQLAPHGSIADIGGGIGLFSAACAAVGMSPTLIDDFADSGYEVYGDEALALHRAVGVKIDNRDVRDGLGLDAASMDVITMIGCIEHMHDSPKRLFAEIMTALRPGGWFLLGAPNCVNLRKRITVPLGHGKWSAMADWYERPVFRGHVREPDVHDLRYVARDMGLHRTMVLGRNWIGQDSRYAWVRLLIPVADPLLRRMPSLCSDIYLLGQKPVPADARAGVPGEYGSRSV